jgi:hypothetical protein
MEPLDTLNWKNLDKGILVEKNEANKKETKGNDKRKVLASLFW